MTRKLLPFLVCSLALLFCACGKFPWEAPPQQRKSYPASATRSPLEEASAALSAGDFPRAELLAQRALSRTKGDRVLDLARIYALAALRNHHPHAALTALEQWRLAGTGADEGREWQEIWCLAMAELSSWTAKERAGDLYQDTSRSAYARGLAGIFLAVRQWEEGRLGDGPTVLENLYASAQDLPLRVMLEQRLALQLRAAGPAAVSLAAGTITPENRDRYPYSIFLLEQLHRQTLDPDTRAEARAALDRLSLPLADPSLTQGLPPSAIILPAPAARVSLDGKPLVLALPISGPLGNTAAKIVAGAEAAVRVLAASGLSLSLVTIDTDQPDWTARVDALPKKAAVIGGPLHPAAYAAAQAQGLFSRRIFFTFLPGLEPGQEGRAAWRFFPSAEDQLDALLRLSASLGVHGYAVFYPEEAYGKRMSALFQSRAEALGFSVHASSYAPDNPASWLRATGNLLAANKNPEHSRGATFQAIFLPDTWKNMDLIVPNIFYYNETRQLLLGSSLWEQGISGGGYVSPQYYTLAVFPGAWNTARAHPEKDRLQAALLPADNIQADFWVGLGYDFVRFAAGLNLPENAAPGSVNAALSSASLEWTIAPIHWDASGRARQALFLFSPVEGGFALVDEAALRKAFGAAWK
ncbi:MAG: penicillin-binding protein activator [Desulfovibrio sp.]|jgi:predicted negative regulator of RcsB-dependent stress response|nr:penicillin-binding protein activator [Desulfovibrio sp.]